MGFLGRSAGGLNLHMRSLIGLALLGGRTLRGCGLGLRPATLVHGDQEGIGLGVVVLILNGDDGHGLFSFLSSGIALG